jgi:hypothetical protein
VAIEELIAAVPPPGHPSEAGPLDAVPDIEKALGTPLPKDAFEFGLRYGSGMFADTLEVYNPFSSNYLVTVHEVCDVYRDLKAQEGDEFIPYDIYPKSPGLLVWGRDVNGHMLFWLTIGQPDQWPLMLMTVDGQFERWACQMTSFLARVFMGEMGCILWDKDWVKQNFVGILFHPK